MKVDIEGGEFAVFGGDEDLGWLDRVDQVVMEVHRNFGDAVALVGQLRQHGFAVDLRDNAGTRVSTTSSRPDYAYFWRYELLYAASALFDAFCNQQVTFRG